MMKNNPFLQYPKFSIFYVVIFIANILVLIYSPENHVIPKAMIMTSLLAFYVSTVVRQDHAFLLGMIFALLGDGFLLFNTMDFFIIGLLSFLVMQISYITVFNRKRRISQAKDYLVPGIIGLVGLGGVFIITRNLENNQLLIVIYSLALLAMTIFAYLRHPKLRGYNFVLIGAILFLISDLVLAINKFVLEIQFGSIIVMATYMTAQFLIVTGETLSTKNKEIKAKKS